VSIIMILPATSVSFPRESDIFCVFTAFGGFKSRRDVPKLVTRHLNGELPIDHYITHTFEGVDKTNQAIDALHSGSCLRAVVRY
jgi:S-(hydroxymethyl)glutathione dehydrogenase/alcohol dehydrogenase